MSRHRHGQRIISWFLLAVLLPMVLQVDLWAKTLDAPLPLPKIADSAKSPLPFRAFRDFRSLKNAFTTTKCADVAEILGVGSVDRTGVVERLRQPDTTLAERTVQYTYDELNRLTEESSTSDLAEANYNTDYVYDLVGNRLAKGTSRNQDGVAENIGYAFNANDQLLAEISSTKGQTDYAYSANGELISKIAPDASYAYTYNLEGRLSGATIKRVENGHNVAISASYAYNQSGIRTRATSTTSINAQPGYATDRVFLVDSANHTGYAQVLEEFTSLNPAPVKSYVLGDDVLAQTSSFTLHTSYLLSDGHGSTRMLAGTTEHITNRYNYDAYGQMLGGQPNITNPASTDLTYSGEQFDAGLQMNYHRARYYDMSAGIWNRLDPFSGNHSDPQSLHKYAYCHGDPVNGMDPTGEITLLEIQAVNAIQVAISTEILDTGRKILRRIEGNFGSSSELNAAIMALDIALTAEAIMSIAVLTYGIVRLGKAARTALKSKPYVLKSLVSRFLKSPGKIKALNRWGPATGIGPIGSLPNGSNILSSFRSMSYTEALVTEPLTLYRIHAPSASSARGLYWTRVKPTGPTQVILDSALLPEWEGNYTRISKIVVPRGQKIYVGAVAEQVGKQRPFQILAGGGDQVVLPSVPESWIRFTKEF